MGAGGRTGFWWTTALTLGFSSFARPLSAQSSGQAFRLEYWAAGHCPDAVEFARQIQTRAPRLRPAKADEPALGFYAELAEHSDSAFGRLTARSPDGREVVREVRGPTCDDVATALALIAALAADPTQPAPPAAGPAAPATGPRPPVSVAGKKPTAEAALPAPPLEPAQRWTFGIGGGLLFDSSIAPSPGYGLNIAFDAEGLGGSAFRPLFALSVIRAAAPNSPTQGGTASFSWVDFRMAACPLRWPEETPLFMRPCAFLDAGVLGAQVSLGGSSRDDSRLWFAFGGFARVEALVQEVVSFQLDGGVTVPLRRDSFGVGGEAPIAFQVPPSGILGRIGLSYRFQ